MYYALCYEHIMCIELMVLVYLEINLSFVMNYFGGYLHAKIKEIYPLLTEILMIKESRSLTAREHFGL